MLKRDIVFRGKSIDNGEWVEGTIHFNGKYILSNKHRNNYHEWVEIIPETVGQFTGRYDKNDKEIFERDIVVNKNIHGKKWIVEYRTDSEYVGFVLKEIGTNGISLFTSWNDIEVIGNIHDNK